MAPASLSRRWFAHSALVMFLLSSTIVGCSASSGVAPSGPSNTADATREIGAMLDGWHEAAARSDETTYFSHFAPEAVFIGTDPGERWNVEAFRRYASPHFSKGKGWSMKALRRVIVVGPSGDVAWFDEDLHSKGMGAVRASGVVVRGGSERRWRVVHYDLSIPVPNEAFEDVRKRIEQEKK
jgi:ketosteroid isomerase-like protein